jgi:hypothetical protein
LGELSYVIEAYWQELVVDPPSLRQLGTGGGLAHRINLARETNSRIGNGTLTPSTEAGDAESEGRYLSGVNYLPDAVKCFAIEQHFLSIGTVIVCPAIGGGVFRVLGNVTLAHTGDSITTQVNHLDVREAVETWEMTVAEILSALISCRHQENQCAYGWIDL